MDRIHPVDSFDLLYRNNRPAPRTGRLWLSILLVGGFHEEVTLWRQEQEPHAGAWRLKSI